MQVGFIGLGNVGAKLAGSLLRNGHALTVDVVLVTGSERDWDRLSARYGLDLPPPAQRFKADSSLIALQMLASGQGSAIIMRRFAQRYLDQGLLVSPLGYEMPLEQGFYLIARTDSKRSDEIRRFSAWLTSQATVI